MTDARKREIAEKAWELFVRWNTTDDDEPVGPDQAIESAKLFLDARDKWMEANQ